MTMTETRDKYEGARANAKGWYETIKEQVEELNAAQVRCREFDNSAAVDKARETIQEGPLSISVRDGWHSPGQPAEDGAEEFEILLTTGGPALRIWAR